MKRINLIPAIALAALTMISCGSSHDSRKINRPGQDSAAVEKSGTPLLDLKDLTDKRKEVFLSQLATKITYVPLETTTKFLIGEKNVHVKPCGEYIFVSEHGKPVGIFDRTGKFMRKIGTIGKGPGEYNFDFIFWPDEASKMVFIWNADAGTIMAFSFEGKHIMDIVPEFRPMSFAPLGNGQFLTWTFMQKETDGKFYRMVFHDESGKTLSRVFEPKIRYDFSGGISIMTPLFTPAPGGYLYNSWENDTIFKVKADGSFKPAFTWLTGKYKMPFDGAKDYSRFLREKANYILDFNAIEGPSAWFLRYDYKNRKELGLYEKAGGEYFVVANPDTAQVGVVNDIDGGPSFFPGWDNEKGQTFVRLIHAIDLIDYRKESSGNNFPPKDPEAASRFRSLVAGINQNSNPVVMLVEMR